MCKLIEMNVNEKLYASDIYINSNLDFFVFCLAIWELNRVKKKQIFFSVLFNWPISIEEEWFVKYWK